MSLTFITVREVICLTLWSKTFFSHTEYKSQRKFKTLNKRYENNSYAASQFNLGYGTSLFRDSDPSIQ